MTNTNIQTLDFTGVSHDSNKKLLDELTFNIAMIRPKEGYHVDIPEELAGSIEDIKQRLELYERYMQSEKEYPKLKPYKPLAMVILKDATVVMVDIFETGNSYTEDIVKEIKDAIDEGETHVQFDNNGSVAVNNVWKVEDFQTKELYIINEENDPKLEPLTIESIEKMDYNELDDTIADVTGWLLNSFDEDNKEQIFLMELLNEAVDQLDQQFLNERYEKERLENILSGFLQQTNLYKMFEEYVEDIKKLQKDPKDTYKVAEEIFGDLNSFMRQNPRFRADFSE
ncbi:hypothetical protein ABET51_06630 [Metabacillus fastidiosus]|uniref:hypothetical protein n=1 Tax=Metabacillus fastidiosus TaxID=1458 RepID=UPI003D2933F1